MGGHLATWKSFRSNLRQHWDNFETTLGHLENKSGTALRQLRDHMVTIQVTTGVAYICPAGSVWPFLLENSFMWLQYCTKQDLLVSIKILLSSGRGCDHDHSSSTSPNILNRAKDPTGLFNNIFASVNIWKRVLEWSYQPEIFSPYLKLNFKQLLHPK